MPDSKQTEAQARAARSGTVAAASTDEPTPTKPEPGSIATPTDPSDGPQEDNRSSMNVTGTNPDAVGPESGLQPLKVGERDWNDVQTRIQGMSGINASDFGQVTYTEGGEDGVDDESVEAFEKAVHRKYPEYAEGRGRQFARAAQRMGYSVSLKT